MNHRLIQSLCRDSGSPAAASSGGCLGAKELKDSFNLTLCLCLNKHLNHLATVVEDPKWVILFGMLLPNSKNCTYNYKVKNNIVYKVNSFIRNVNM